MEWLGWGCDRAAGTNQSPVGSNFRRFRGFPSKISQPGFLRWLLEGVSAGFRDIPAGLSSLVVGRRIGWLPGHPSRAFFVGCWKVYRLASGTSQPGFLRWMLEVRGRGAARSLGPTGRDARYGCFRAKVDEIPGLFRPRLPGQERDALATFQMETQGDFACECPSGP
jgi:hypothetical protein